MKTCAPLFPNTRERSGTQCSLHIWKGIALPSPCVDTATSAPALRLCIDHLRHPLEGDMAEGTEKPHIRGSSRRTTKSEDTRDLALRRGDVDFVSGEFGLSPKAERSRAPWYRYLPDPRAGRPSRWHCRFCPANITGSVAPCESAVNREGVSRLVAERGTTDRYGLPSRRRSPATRSTRYQQQVLLRHW